LCRSPIAAARLDAFSLIEGALMTSIEVAASVPKHRGHVASYGTGRTCSMPGCSTRLSIYNQLARCAVHATTP